LSGWFYRKFVVRILELDDTPREIARGIALGVFIAMTPTVGIQMIAIATVCTIAGGNRLAGVAMAWISNPLTIVPIYWLDYFIGSMILRTRMVAIGEIARVVDLKSTGIFSMFFEFLGNLGSMAVNLAGPMFLGGAILGIICAIPAYYVSVPLFTKWKEAFSSDSKLASGKDEDTTRSEAREEESAHDGSGSA
jgi:uncharacterized protein (DUF2062 family)